MTDASVSGNSEKVRNPSRSFFRIDKMEVEPTRYVVYWTRWNANHELTGTFAFESAPEEHLWRKWLEFEDYLFERIEADLGR